MYNSTPPIHVEFVHVTLYSTYIDNTVHYPLHYMYSTYMYIRNYTVHYSYIHCNTVHYPYMYIHVHVYSTLPILYIHVHVYSTLPISLSS